MECPLPEPATGLLWFLKYPSSLRMVPEGIRVALSQQSGNPDKLVFEEMRELLVTQMADLEGGSMHRQPSGFWVLLTETDKIRPHHGCCEVSDNLWVWWKLS